MNNFPKAHKNLSTLYFQCMLFWITSFIWKYVLWNQLIRGILLLEFWFMEGEENEELNQL